MYFRNVLLYHREWVSTIIEAPYREILLMVGSKLRALRAITFFLVQDELPCGGCPRIDDDIFCITTSLLGVLSSVLFGNRQY